jgi:hypothetical protein
MRDKMNWKLNVSKLIIYLVLLLTSISCQITRLIPISSGKSSITGVLFSTTGNGPIPSTLYYLIPANQDGTYPNILVGPVAEENLKGFSDEQGRITLKDIVPGDYYLAVWAPYNWIIAIKSENDTQPRVITVIPNHHEDLGLILLPWP